MQSKEIEQLDSEFEKCQRILIALGDEKTASHDSGKDE